VTVTHKLMRIEMRIGLDLGGTKIEGILLSNGGAIEQKVRVETPSDNYRKTVDSICRLVKSLQPPTPVPVGIGTPGSLVLPEGLMKNSNSVCLNNKPLQRDVETKLGYEIRIENDANCFILSEAIYGAAADAQSAFGVILGTGCGGGFVINKRLVTGPNGIAGEWGHNCIPVSVRDLIKQDRICHCGRTNCIETVISGRGLAQTHFENFNQTLEASEIAQLAENNNSDAMKSIDTYAQQLAYSLVTIVNMVDPHSIVLGGGISNIRALYELVPKYLNHVIFNDAVHTKILPPAFGDASGAIGAACLWPEN